MSRPSADPPAAILGRLRESGRRWCSPLRRAGCRQTQLRGSCGRCSTQRCVDPCQAAGWPPGSRHAMAAPGRGGHVSVGAQRRLLHTEVGVDRLTRTLTNIEFDPIRHPIMVPVAVRVIEQTLNTPLRTRPVTMEVVDTRRVERIIIVTTPTGFRPINTSTEFARRSASYLAAHGYSPLQIERALVAELAVSNSAAADIASRFAA